MKTHLLRTAAILTSTLILSVTTITQTPHAVADNTAVESEQLLDSSTSSATEKTTLAFDPQSTTQGNGSEHSNFISPFLETLTNPLLAPAGANDWGCRPSPQHPNPVILIHGTWENAYDNWAAMSPALKRDGYCVFTPNVGRISFAEQGGAGALLPNTFGVGPVETSTEQLSQFIDHVLKMTGAKKVDLVGHSQGGLLAKLYTLRRASQNHTDDQSANVENVVTLGADHHGTTGSGFSNLGTEQMAVEGSLSTTDGTPIGSTGGHVDRSLKDLNKVINLSDTQRVEIQKWVAGIAVAEQVANSEFVSKLNETEDTLPGIRYTVIGSEFDNIVTPFQSTFLTPGPGAVVHNVVLQDGCRQDQSSHVSMSYSPRAIDIVRNALDNHPNPTENVRCTAQTGALGFSLKSHA